MSNTFEEVKISKRMREDWDLRISHDYRYWMSDGVSSDETMWQTGERDLDILLEGIDKRILSDATLLEIGCGVGRIVQAASHHVSHVIGVDVSQKAIDLAISLNRNENATFILGNGLDLSQIPNDAIDIGISFASLGSMPAHVFANYIIELSRVVKNGGIIRVQIYLGQEQIIPREDTLALRSYDLERVESALSLAGFTIDFIKEVTLPFEVSDYEKGVVAYILGAKKNTTANVTKDAFLGSLLSQSEYTAGDDWKGSSAAHFVALARAAQCLEAGQLADAVHALDVAKKEYSDTTVEYIEIENRIRAAQNILPQSVQRDIIDLQNTDLRYFDTTEGRAIEYKGVILSHKTNPKKSARVWAERTLRTIHKKQEPILVVGLGDSIFVNILSELTERSIKVIETDKTVIQSSRHTLHPHVTLLTNINEVKGIDASNFDIVYLPSLPFYNKTLCDEVRVLCTAQKFERTLDPKIAIVGPFMGGTLPIANYIKRAFFQLEKEAHFIDLSSFASTFTGLSSMLHKQNRQSVIENSFVELVSNLVLQIVEERSIDILITVAQAPLAPSILEKLREKGVITVHWFMEDTRRFQTWKQIAPYYDYFYTIQKGESLEEVQQAGGHRVRYLPLACDPTIHIPLTLSIKEKEEFGSLVSFVGAGYNNRRHVFSKMSDLDFKIWGTEWPLATPFDRIVQRQGARISVDDYIKIFNASTINLNLHSSQERDGVDPSGDFVNPRVFELASCGAFQLTDHRALLPELFIPGKEIVTFSHEKEIRECIQHYTDRPDEREQITYAARKKVLADHTYTIRMKTILRHVYAEYGDHLQKRSDTGEWQRTLQKSKKFPELYDLLEKTYKNKEEPSLDNLVKPFKDGNTVLSEVEQKLLFMNHMRGQITQIQRLRQE